MIIERWIQEQAEAAKPKRDGLFYDPWLASAFAVLCWLIIGMVVFLVVSSPSQAQDGWPWTEFSNENKVHKIHKRRRYHRRKPRVKGYIYRKRRKRKPTHGFQCAREFRVWSEVKSSEKRAKASAWDKFHGASKFELGERFSDVRFARKARFECVRSNSETLVSKSLEAAGGAGVHRYRCLLLATACKPSMSKEE